MTNKLIYALAAFTLTLTSCSTDEQSEIQSSVSNTKAAARVVSTTNACPNSIKLVGNSPDGNKVQLVFDKDNTPALVRVVYNGVVTNDVSAPSGKSGEWNSTDKYPTPALRIQLLDSTGTVKCNCIYNNEGQFLKSFVIEEIEFIVEEVERG